jgi:hypothetical protein
VADERDFGEHLFEEGLVQICVTRLRPPRIIMKVLAMRLAYTFCAAAGAGPGLGRSSHQHCGDAFILRLCGKEWGEEAVQGGRGGDHDEEASEDGGAGPLRQLAPLLAAVRLPLRVGTAR